MGDYTKSNAVTLLAVKDGGLFASVGFDSADQSFSEAAIEHCSEGNEIVTLNGEFKVSDLLDLELMGWNRPGDPENVVLIDCKPVIEALRQNLESMLTKIKAIEYRDA